MKKLIAGFVIVVTIICCNQPNKTETPDSTSTSSPTGADMKALYDKNLSTLQTGISAFEKEDLNGWAATVADSARWASPTWSCT